MSQEARILAYCLLKWIPQNMFCGGRYLLKLSSNTQQCDAIGGMLDEGLKTFLDSRVGLLGLFALGDIPDEHGNSSISVIGIDDWAESCQEPAFATHDFQR